MRDAVLFEKLKGFGCDELPVILDNLVTLPLGRILCERSPRFGKFDDAPVSKLDVECRRKPFAPFGKSGLMPDPLDHPSVLIAERIKKKLELFGIGRRLGVVAVCVNSIDDVRESVRIDVLSCLSHCLKRSISGYP